MDWYSGPTLLEHLETVPIDSAADEAKSFRMPVQWVNRPDQNFRGFAGQVASGRIAPGDAQRIQRALEVWRLTGRALSSFQTGARVELPFRLVSFAIVPPDRALLHRHIQERFDAMLEAGLIEEVQSLRRRYRLSADLPSMRCVGYRQVWDYQDGAYDRAVMRDKAIAATRQLAKRQMTWLRSFKDVELLAERGANLLAERMKSG
jgi:tRNA dimethylallyltransferase